jgi:hypothetical protein|tara:strand:- start:680 stop:1000 length:321 start_codon:yes stop_codon:yes gene_type:complete
MNFDTLIFCEGIVEPPTESLAIRGLCIYLNAFSRPRSFLLETKRETVDMYYGWIKKIGMHDFIEEIVYPDYDIEGLRISETKTRSPYLKVDRISWDNLNFVLKRIS